ncbi:hypothetical protein sscle_05g042120 [Sclerotinia sclerotiorum 1980 UF-70]|uniref:Uncharacterized protein n=1 Tax=Sclerotinia sclerotiorum (strain ATCC 18683 / 1980 / Ss-1) TaxID=665079 RepID=A0A1D9Q3Q7_SCLS1|nr:hypothetical protein sscle_05g042120 [Sclerotinia sclerotiorum 1980 UF-70]
MFDGSMLQIEILTRPRRFTSFSVRVGTGAVNKTFASDRDTLQKDIWFDFNPNLHGDEPVSRLPPQGYCGYRGKFHNYICHMRNELSMEFRSLRDSHGNLNSTVYAKLHGNRHSLTHYSTN